MQNLVYRQENFQRISISIKKEAQC